MKLAIRLCVLALAAQTCLAGPGWGERVAGLKLVMAEADSLFAVGRADDVVATLLPLLDEGDLGSEVMWPLEQRIGLAYQALGRYQEALPHLERAVLWAQTDAANHRNLANLLLRLGKSGRAFSEYRDACSLAPDDWNVRVEFAHVLMDYGQAERAESLIEEAASRCPDCSEVARAFVRYHLIRADYASALSPMMVLHEAAPTAETREQLSIVLLRAGQPARARDLLLLDWPDRLSDAERRVVLEADHDLGDALRARALIDANGASWDDPSFWGLAALICYDQGDDVAGLALVDRAIVLSPGDAALRNNRVAFLMRLGRHDEADREWGVVLQLDPSLADNRKIITE